MKTAVTAKKTATAPNRLKNGVQSSVVEKPQAKMSTVPAKKKEVSLQQVQEKAYELFLRRNGGSGSAEGDWAEAERILKGA